MSNEKNASKKLRLLLFSQQSPFIDIYSIFIKYFENSKLNYYNIRDKNHYEFSLKSFPDLSILINYYQEKKENEKSDKYNIYNFFLIFIDIQQKYENTNNFLDETFDKIIAFSEDNLNKKYYIFGFYSNDDKEKINKNNIETNLESKGIEYLYYEIKKDDLENFKNNLKFIINDCNSIMIEKFLEQKQNELIPDASKSKCILF